MAYLDTDAADAIEARIAQVERRTGVQIVTAVVGRSDLYVELPWKAFALGASFASLVAVLIDALRPDWLTSGVVIAHVVAILGVGASSALAAVFIPAYARLFLGTARRDLESRTYAQSLFLRHELFSTQRRDGVLILVSCFERKVQILADTGLHGRVAERDWAGVIASMGRPLARRRFGEALLTGLEATEALLLAKGLHGLGDTINELPDRPFEEAG